MENCKPFQGRVHRYFDEARDCLMSYFDRYVPETVRVISTCETDFCLNPEHLIEIPPKRLEYPRGICVYCGAPGWTKDHVLPRNWTGEAQRRQIWIVPSCGECNSFIGDSLANSIEDRRAIAHEQIRKKYQGILRTKDFSEKELSEFGPGLRSVIEISLQNKEQLTYRLGWPQDPYYDARAFDKSF